jgi:hypothetical protein
MRTAPPGWLPDARTEPEALIREARSRQRRRWLAAGAAVLMVSAGVAAAVTAGSGADRRPPPGRPAAGTVKPAPPAMSGVPMPAGSSLQLLLTGPRPAWFWLATGHAVPIKGLSWDRWGYSFTRVAGGWSALPGTAGPACGAFCADRPACAAMCAGPPVLYYFIADGSARAARLASGVGVAASDGSGAVWLITYRRSDADITTTPALAQEVTTAGRPLGPRYRLPAGYQPLRAVGRDLLLGPVAGEAPQEAVVDKLWDPVTRRVVRTFADVIAAGPQAIAWGPICVHCPVHVLNLLTGTNATIPLPRGAWATTNQGTFSPDGRYLAFALWAGTARDGGPTLTRIAVIDIKDPRLLIVPGSTLSWDVTNRASRLSFGWQPRGHRLIAVLPGSGQTIQVASWQPGQARLWVATTQIPPGTSAVVGEYG